MRALILQSHCVCVMTSSLWECMLAPPPSSIMSYSLPHPASQTPPPDLSTPAFGPATSSPKEPLTLTEGLSPLALELEDTPTGSSSAPCNHTEVKGRVSSARKQWQKSKVPLHHMVNCKMYFVVQTRATCSVHEHLCC